MLPQKAVPEPARPRSTNPATNRPRGVSGVYVAAISRSSCLSQRRAAPAGGGIALPLCEASHATRFRAMITCRAERDTSLWVGCEAAHEATQSHLDLLAVRRRAAVPGSLRELLDCFE